MNFTINEDLNVAVQSGPFDEAANPGTVGFSTKSQFEKATANWPSSKLIDLWNSFAGVAPFSELAPVKKFETRGRATDRIWGAIQRLGGEANGTSTDSSVEDAPPSPKPAKAAKAKAPKATRKPTETDCLLSTKRLVLVTLMKRPGGATVQQMATGADSSKSSVANMIYWIKRDFPGKVSVLRTPERQTVYTLKA